MLLQFTESHQLACMAESTSQKCCITCCIQLCTLLCLCASRHMPASSNTAIDRAGLMEGRANRHLWRTFSSISTS